jgi:hypothetical protein
MIAAKRVDNFRKFAAELRGYPELKHQADAFEHALAHDDLIADTNSDMAAVLFGVEWILRQPRHIEEKIEQMGRLFALEGKVHIASMRDFTGWK